MIGQIGEHLHKFYKLLFFQGEEVNPLKGVLPNAGTVVALTVSALVCFTSETHVYDHTSPAHFVAHIAIGGVCFVLTVGQIVLSEPFLNTVVVEFLRSKKILKTD